MTLTQEEAHRLFEYKDGVLYWRERPKFSRKPKGDMEAGTVSGHGYKKIGIKQKRVYVHQVIFLMQHGFIPEVVDHIDGNTNNNKIENLRASNKSLNACNSKLPSNNTSGTKGVVWLKRECKWVARVQFNKKVIYLGTFSNIELASLVAEEARILYHGKYAKI
jgi:HNH endonuclease